MDVVGGASRHFGVDAAGVIAAHAAQGAVIVRRRIGPESQMELIGRAAQVIEHAPGLHQRYLALWIEAKDVVHVLRHIHDHCNIATLAGQTGAAAAAQDGRAESAGRRHRFHHVLDVPRDHHADGHLPIVGAIGGVERARAAVETDFTADPGAQVSFESCRVARPLARMRGAFHIFASDR